MIDEAFLKWTPAAFGKALRGSGVAIVRKAIAEGKVHFFQRNLSEAFNVLKTIDQSSLEQWHWRDWWPNNPPEVSVDKAQKLMPNDRMLQSVTGDALSFFELISDPRLQHLLAGGFPGQKFLPSIVAHCRNITPDKPADAVSCHIDIRYHREGPFGLNFWVPLAPAGEIWGTPGLEIWPLGFRQMQRYFGHDGVDADVPFNDQLMANIPAIFGPPVRVNINLGDLMVFSSWTPHRTYIPEGCKTGRLSVEVRLTSPEVPPSRLARAWRVLWS